MQLLASNTKEDDQDKAECEIKLERHKFLQPFHTWFARVITLKHTNPFSSKYTRNGFLRLQLQDFGSLLFHCVFHPRLAFTLMLFLEAVREDGSQDINELLLIVFHLRFVVWRNRVWYLIHICVYPP